MSKVRLLIIIFFASVQADYGQTSLTGLRLFKSFPEKQSKNIIMVGESHSSSVGSTIFPQLVAYLNRHTGMRRVLIEFGPSEAYFYNRYLQTGQEKYLAYTIYGGYYKDWKEAWRTIYQLNKQLSTPLKITGVDFDRARTLGYALYNMFQPYADKPHYIDSLMDTIRSKAFFKTYSNDYPNTLDKAFMTDVKKLLTAHRDFLKNFLTKEDNQLIDEIINNNVSGFGDKREKDLAENITDCVLTSDEQVFFMMVGRDHVYTNAYYNKDKMRLSAWLKKDPKLRVLAGLILKENSKDWDGSYKKQITQFEVRDKDPWKDYREAIYKRIKTDLSIIPLKDKLSGLSYYTDYILVAKDQPAISVGN